MPQKLSKQAVWERWVSETVLEDIQASTTPDPVPMIDDTGDTLEMTATFDSYRLGRGSGDYLYLLYLLDEPVESPADVVPVYIGETGQIASRLMSHFRRLRTSLPISEWEDDGSWGSYGKYDHIATVYDHFDSPLCAWVVDVSELDVGPYGFPTYRQELEAKTVGLVHSYPKFNRVFANRDFVPNRVPHEMGKVGPKWVTMDATTANEETALGREEVAPNTTADTKPALWYDWVEQTICREIHDPEAADPIPLFETDEELVVKLKSGGKSPVLKRSAEIDARIRQEGNRCVHSSGVTDGPEGLLYVMYQLESANPEPQDIIPRYIGKAEAYGKKNELSANFEEIAKDRAATRSFARWGDGSYWHIGELSETVFGVDSKKLSWASELFYQGTHQLKKQTYLWIRAWDPNQYPGPYEYPAYLAEVEALLIGLVYKTYPDQLLNHKEVPNDAPANQREWLW